MFKLPPFQQPELLEQALTHRSYLQDNPDYGRHNERLEFLGDAVLGFLIGARLYKQYPDLTEGDLTRWRSHLVDQRQLASLAQKLGLNQQLRVGRGVEGQDGRNRPSVLCAAFEAVIGAYFLEAGLEAVRSYVEELFTPLIETLARHGLDIDPKSKFQQWALANLGPQNPTYQILAESGPDHNKRFEAGVYVAQQLYGQGTGSSKSEATKQAAIAALAQLGLN